MAYDTMLYRGTATAGTEVQLQQIIGPSTIRAGYGKARLVSVQSFYHSTNSADAPKLSVEYKNSGWVRSNKLWSADFMDETAHSTSTFNHVYGHGFELQPNSTFLVTAKDLTSTAFSGTVTVDVLITVDYDAVPSINPDAYAGCPITFECLQPAAVSAAASTVLRLGSYDVLDPNVTYCINEVSSSNPIGMMYAIISGLQPQQGLTRILPVPPVGAKIVPTVQGSVAFSKQSFDVSVLSDVAISSQLIPINLELLANKNGL